MKKEWKIGNGEMKNLTTICFLLSDKRRTARRDKEVQEAAKALAKEGMRAYDCTGSDEAGLPLLRRGEECSEASERKPAQAVIPVRSQAEYGKDPGRKQLWDDASGLEDEPVLILTDSPVWFQVLKQLGFPAAGYLHDGNKGETFTGAAYLLEQPQEVDADSYVKIWQRLCSFPWTIAVTKRLVIREMTVGDLDDLYRLYEDPETRAFLQPPSPDREKETAILSAYIEKVYGFCGYGMWAVCGKESGSMIGRIGFEPYHGGGDAVDFGYLIRKDLRGQGLALEAAEAALQFAKEALGLTRVCIHTDARNAASVALARRLGFSEEMEKTEDPAGKIAADRSTSEESAARSMPAVDGSQKTGIRYFVKDLSATKENGYDQ